MTTAVYALEDVPAYQYFKFVFEIEQGAPVSFGEIQLLGTLDFGRFYPDLTAFSYITASDGNSVSPLTDDNGYSYASLSGEEAHWHINLPVPTRVLAYSIVSANDAGLDPKEVTLIGTQEDGSETSLSKRTLNFSTRGSRSTNSISSSKLFTSLDLNIISTASGGTETRIAELEIYGTAIAETGWPGLYLPVEVSSSAQPASATEGVEKLSDQNKTTRYRTAFEGPQSIMFSFSEPQFIETYALTASKDEESRDPRSWTLEGSLDGETWTLLDRRSDQAFSQRYATQFYRLVSPAAYQFYRLTVTEVNGSNQLQIAQLQMFAFESTDLASVQAQEELTMNLRHGLLSIFAPEAAVLTIHDMQGRQLVRQSVAKGYSTFPLGMLSRGLYVISIQAGEKKVARTVKR